MSVDLCSVSLPRVWLGLQPLVQQPRQRIPRVSQSRNVLCQFGVDGRLLIAFHADYQAENNLWLGIEVNTSIICICIPPLKATIVRFFPRIFQSSSYNSRPTINYRTRSGTYPLSDDSLKQTTSASFPNPVSSTGRGFSRTVVTGGSRSYAVSDSALSDEVVMLEELASNGDDRDMGRRRDDIAKKTEVEISYTEIP